jgi:5'-3' exonuclease
MAPLLIADVPWLLYRAFFSLPKSITDSRGQPVNALLGTINALLTAADATAPRAIVACMGNEQADYRVRLYPPYHAHRPPMPPELAAQWERAPALLESLGWTFNESKQLEADDVMFSYACTEQERAGSALLLTADRDLFAAVSEQVSVLELGKGKRAPLEVGPAEVRARYGVGPELVSDFIALRGDPSDGIPGAPGVGAKTAASVLQRFGSLERAIEAAAEPRAVIAGELSPRLAAALRDNAEQLRVFKQVATLQRIEVKAPQDRATDFASGAAAATELGMKRLAARLEALAGSATA